MAEFSQKQRKQSGSEGLGSVVDFLLANARLVLGVGGAAVLGIATLAVKRLCHGPRCSDLCHFAYSSSTGPPALQMRMTPRGTAGRN
ncbi:Smith-Magenis syndrome chromosome region, candidate 7 homolog (human), isoform CRA_b [Mus musculus]|nr:Smith-Magenis syndrome chromosome region, candidate 7 homolog (human), isoform CRA_b [Mus musculus]